MASLLKPFAAFALIIATTGSAFADTYHHIDQLALTIERQSKRLVSESRHYRHTPEYRHLVADARDMARLADHIHDIAHDHGCLVALQSDLALLDSRFHHLESVFDRVERCAAYGHGHVHGNTSHVKRLLNSIEDNIHHLQDDVRSLLNPVHSTPRVVVTRTTGFPAYHSSHWGGYNVRPQSSGFGYGHSSHAHYPRSRGITIGGGSSRFTIRF